MTEQWRPVVGYEGLYEVSDAGRVRSTRRKGAPGGLRKMHRAKAGGYWLVSLCRDGIQIPKHAHVLVMEAFVGPRSKGMQIRHIDGDPQNTCLSNLAYGTPGDNALDRVRHGTHNMASKTHCLRGHAFDARNTRLTRDGRRECRACQNERNRAKRRDARLARYGPERTS